MPLTQKTNGNFETLCAAVPEPYGPLTRVGSLPNQSINSNVKIQVTSALSVTLFISYDELLDTDKTYDLLHEAHQERGVNAHINQLASVGMALTAILIPDGTTPTTDANAALALRIANLAKPLIMGLPEVAYTEYDEAQVKVGDGLVIANTAGQEYTFTCDIDQGSWIGWFVYTDALSPEPIEYVLSTGSNDPEITFDYTADGADATYDIKATLITTAGIYYFEDTLVIAAI